jgi:hypothetical protein
MEQNAIRAVMFPEFAALLPDYLLPKPGHNGIMIPARADGRNPSTPTTINIRIQILAWMHDGLHSAYQRQFLSLMV